MFPEDVVLHMYACVQTLSDELEVLLGIMKQGRAKRKSLHLNNVIQQQLTLRKPDFSDWGKKNPKQ